MRKCVARCLRCFVFCGLLSIVPGAAHGQDTLVVVFGQVKDITTREPLADIQVDAIDLKYGRRVLATLLPDGRYELDFLQEAEYMVEYSARGYVPKRIRLGFIGPSPEEWAGGFGMEVDMTLFREVQDLDLTFGGEPMGICRYDRDSASFEWDMAYVERMRARMEQMMKLYEKRIAGAR